MADNSDDENSLLLDEEDKSFLAQGMDAGMSTVEIEPSSMPLGRNIIEDQQPSINVPSLNSQKKFIFAAQFL